MDLDAPHHKGKELDINQLQETQQRAKLNLILNYKI